MSGQLNRSVTTTECPWLDGDLPEGKVVHRYDGVTYGCITESGVAVTDEPNQTPFYEVPRDSVTWKEG
jgi:hypothetical protein|tara:strand:- start:639 stop:842 length:204 start_codon:yes stop_codon:yes gene_type:complete